MFKRLVLIGMVILMWGWGAEIYGEIYVKNDSNWVWFDKDSSQHSDVELDSMIRTHKIWVKRLHQIAERHKKNGVSTDETLARIFSLMYDPYWPYKYTKTEDDQFEELHYLMEETERIILDDVELARVILTYTNLSGASFSNANMQNTRLDHSVFIGTDFSNASLVGASMKKANLTGATFYRSNLTGATMDDANLTKVIFRNTNLTGARLWYANLKGAVLYKSNLLRTDLRECNLEEAIFEVDSLPPPQFIALARNIDQLTYRSNPASLVKLRQSLYNAGFRTQSKLVNASIQRHDANWFIYLLFDFTCGYGTKPWQPLIYVFYILVIGIIFYFVVMQFHRDWGIVKVSLVHKIRVQGGEEYIKEKVLRVSVKDGRLIRRVFRFLKMEIRLFGFAFLYSLLSSTRLGFREFNPNHIIRMLLTQEIDMTAFGWVRVISGIQSILSIILIAMFLLSFFGWSFEF